jgi:hypothetical protein
VADGRAAMKHPDHLGHAISTEARQVDNLWRGYYSVDRGSFVAVGRLSTLQTTAHTAALADAKRAIHRTQDAKRHAGR